jgi:hypothetical protein
MEDDPNGDGFLAAPRRSFGLSFALSGVGLDSSTL